MTLKDLRDYLIQNPNNLPEDTPIICHGYAAHFEDIEDIRIVKVILGGNKEVWYHGTHIEYDPGEPLGPTEKVSEALLLE